MQKQASPARFSGYHPLCGMEKPIPPQYIPKELEKAVAIAQRQFYNIAKQKQQNTDRNFYPKLLIKIKDMPKPSHNPDGTTIAEIVGFDYQNKEEREMNDNWLANLPKFDEVDCIQVPCTCQPLPQNDYEQIFGVDNNSNNEKVILYRTCKRTLFAAAKRQLKSAPTPNAKVAKDFVAWSKNKIEQWIGDALDNFGYSYNQWFNHLNANKQKAIMKEVEEIKEKYGLDFDPQSPDKDIWKLFHYEGICKKELQNSDGKPRMVCSIPQLTKFIMGPVCWKLEQIFQDHIPCYCGGKNLTQMQDEINEFIDEGFVQVAEGDGSAFDNTQDVMLKEIDRYIYRRVADKVYHVPQKLFLYATQQYYKIMDIVHVDPLSKKRETLFSYAVLGTVFSGDCDTTLMNTLRMGLYNMYVNEMAGLKHKQDFICFAKGDDFTVMYTNKITKSMVEAAYYRYFLPKTKLKNQLGLEYDDREFGLGQILKFIEIGEPTIIKFCSLRAWYINPYNQHIYLTRDPAKFYTVGAYSRKMRLLNAKQAKLYLYDQAYALQVNYPGVHFFEHVQKLYYSKINTMGKDGLAIPRCGTARDRRQTLSLEIDGYDIEAFFYNKAPRTDKYFKIRSQKSYWESVKYYERSQTQKLTPEELYYVNLQIDNEFPAYELYAS